jgi:hypothetical protein
MQTIELWLCLSVPREAMVQTSQVLHKTDG